MDELCTDLKNIFCTHELWLNANWPIIVSDCPLSQGLEEGQNFLTLQPDKYEWFPEAQDSWF